MKSKKIKVNEKEFEVKSAPLRKLLEALKVIEKFPDKIEELDLEDETSNVKIFARVLSQSGDEVFDLLENLSGIPSEEVSELDLADTISLIKALLEVNDIELIKKGFGEIKDMFSEKKVAKK